MFASSKAYLSLIGTRQVHLAYKWLWDCCCRPKRKFFFWLLLKDGLSTRGLLKYRNMDLESYSCVLCHFDTEETLQHLFFHCSFVMCCWNTLGLATRYKMIFWILFQFSGYIYNSLFS